MTTTFLGDWSNHDWQRGTMDFVAMARDAIAGGTHKTSDGLRFYADPYWPGAIARMRQAFTGGVYGSYHVLWGNRDIGQQIDWWFSILDATAPGWRTDPRFVLMTDNEPFGYNSAPTVGQVNQAGDIIRAKVHKVMLAYCPPWHYGAALGSLRYPLVSSNYGTNPVAPYRNAYPGDGSPRWGSAALLQYGSRTRMGSQSTCDANAYRGPLSQLLAATSPATTITQGDDTMKTVLVTVNGGDGKVYLSNGIMRFHVGDYTQNDNVTGPEVVLRDIVGGANALFGSLVDATVRQVADLDAFGVEIPTNLAGILADIEAKVANLGAGGQSAAPSQDQVAAAVAAALPGVLTESLQNPDVAKAIGAGFLAALRGA